MGQTIANIIDEPAIRKQLKKATSSTDLQRSLKKILPNNASGLTITLNGTKKVSFLFQGKIHEIVV